MSRKDPRFDPQYQKNQQQTRESTNQIQGKEIGNTTILTEHLVNGSVTSEKLSSISIPQPFHCADHLSTTTSGWVRVARLNNLSAVEFWVRATTSGNHNIAKFVGTYCFMGSGTPQITFKMVSNARYGSGFTSVRLVYNGVYDPIYFEIYVPTANTYVAVGQVSAFGATFANFSNITLEAGGIPSGYSIYPSANAGYSPSNSSMTFGNYDSAIITL